MAQSNEERRADYIAALEGRGFLHLEQIERLAADVEAGQIDARAGDVATEHELGLQAG